MVKPPIHSRTATLDELRANILPNFIHPVPSRDTVRSWLESARVPRFKSNPLAKRGGGPVYYSVSHVENSSAVARACRPSEPLKRKSPGCDPEANN